MFYVMSDIHGEYEKYLSMLKLINFRDNDELFVFGDNVNEVKESIELTVNYDGAP